MRIQIKHCYATRTLEEIAVQEAENAANHFLASLDPDRVVSVSTQLIGQTNLDPSCLITIVYRSE